MGLSRPVSSENPEITVVVPTIPSRSHEAVLERLRDQEGVDYEVILVDDAAVGVCEARNRGLEAATAELVAFTDDDCLPPRDWLRRIVSRFEESPGLVILEGKTTGGMEYAGTRKYPTCNLAVDRETAIRVGGFREEFEYWREDTEFGWRMEEAGEYAYAPDVAMCHPAETGSEIKEENEARLRREYPDRYEEVLIPDTILGKVNNWLWRKGFFDTVERIRP